MNLLRLQSFRLSSLKNNYMSYIKRIYKKYWFIRWFWWLGVVIPGVPFIIVTLAFFLFMHWPRNYDEVINIPLFSDVEFISLSAHGVKDSPSSWSDLLQSTYQGQLKGQVNSQHISLNWQSYSNNALICSVTGKEIGRQLGVKLSKLEHLKKVHLIGHSCGAFIILGVCNTLKELNPKLYIQSTYLDPVSVYSGILWNYGLKNFGLCADFSDAYIDTQDGVPGSNQAQPHSFTFDVTEKRIKQGEKYPPHAWPTIFYIDALTKKQVPTPLSRQPALFHDLTKNTLIHWPY